MSAAFLHFHTFNMAHRNIIGDERLAAICNALANGIGIIRAARRFGVSEHTVIAIRLAPGIDSNSGKRIKPDLRQDSERVGGALLGSLVAGIIQPAQLPVEMGIIFDKKGAAQASHQFMPSRENVRVRNRGCESVGRENEYAEKSKMMRNLRIIQKEDARISNKLWVFIRTDAPFDALSLLRNPVDARNWSVRLGPHWTESPMHLGRGRPRNCLRQEGGGGSDPAKSPKGSMVSFAENLTERASSIDPQNFNASKASLNARKKIAQKRPTPAKKTRRSELPGASPK